jgi:hypothetical protein
LEAPSEELKKIAASEIPDSVPTIFVVANLSVQKKPRSLLQYLKA